MSHSDRSVEVSTSSQGPGEFFHSSVDRWFLLKGNRWIVAGLFLVVVFVAFFLLGWSGVIEVTAGGPSTALLSAFIAGNLTLVPIAITINQLVLSREFGKPHDLRERDEGVIQLREDLKEIAGISFIRPTPEAFLRELIVAIEGTMTAAGDEELRRHVHRFREEVTANTDRMSHALNEADFGSYELLSAMLEVNSAWLIGVTKFLREGHTEAVAGEPIDRMEEALHPAVYEDALRAAGNRRPVSAVAVHRVPRTPRLLARGVDLRDDDRDATPRDAPAGRLQPRRHPRVHAAGIPDVVHTPPLDAHELPPLQNSFITDG